MSNNEDLIIAIGQIFAAYGKEAQPEDLKLWLNLLGDYDPLVIGEALKAHAKNPDGGKWIPRPADIIGLIEGKSADRASIAWTKVDKAIRSVGVYPSVVFDDPVIHLVIEDMGGWIKLGNQTEKEWPFIARDFEKRYGEYANRPRLPRPIKMLTGLADSSNSAEGHKLAIEPMLIGNTQSAQRLYENGRDKPRLTFTKASIDNGLLSIGHQASEKLRLMNAANEG